MSAPLAERLYLAYCASSGGKNFRGEPCPEWAALPEAIRGHWRAVALDATAHVLETCELALAKVVSSLKKG